MWWRTFAFILLAVLLACVLGLDADAMKSDITDDEVYFEHLNNETDSVYIGQYSISLVTYFSQNATDHEVVASAPFFSYNLSGMMPRLREGGGASHHSIQLNPTMVPGHYDIPVWFNYTADNGTFIAQLFDLYLDVVMAWELRDFRITSTNDLVLELETYLPCKLLLVEFDTDGSLEVAPREFRVADAGPGTYRFEGHLSTTIWPRDDRDEVGYDVRGLFNGTTLQLWEKNIPPSRVTEDGADGRSSLLLIVILGVVVAAVVLIRLRRRRRGPGGNRPERGPS